MLQTLGHQEGLGPCFTLANQHTESFLARPIFCPGFAPFPFLLAFFPQASGCQPHQLRAPTLFQWPAFPEAPVAGRQRVDRNPCPSFPKFIGAAGHDLGPQQNTPHPRLCLWKPLQLGSSVSSIEFFFSLPFKSF